MIKQPASFPLVIAETPSSVMASNTESCPSEHLETEQKQSEGEEERKRDEVFFSQTEVLLSVETKQELQSKLQR